MPYRVGKYTLIIENTPPVESFAAVGSKKEGEGPLGNSFDVVGDDDKFGQDTWEEAESTLQKEAVTLALGKGKCEAFEVRYLFAGDLLGQEMASSFGLAEMEIPMFGVYGACSTAGESLSLAALTVAAGAADYVCAITSSHFASAEKQFRFPLEYNLLTINYIYSTLYWIQYATTTQVKDDVFSFASRFLNVCFHILAEYADSDARHGGRFYLNRRTISCSNGHVQTEGIQI